MNLFIVSKKVILTATLLFVFAGLFSQEKEKKKVHIKVEKNDVTTVDTSFTVDEDMDEAEIETMINELAGKDNKHIYGVHLFEDEGDEDFEVYTINVDKKKLDSLKDYDHNKVIIKRFGDCDSSVVIKRGRKVIMEDISGDKNAHSYFFKSKDSADIVKGTKKMKVYVSTDDKDDHKIIHKHGSKDGIKWIDDESGDHYVIKKGDKGKEIVFSDHGPEKSERKVIVLESDENPVHFITEDGVELKLIAKDKKTGTDIALDKLKVLKIKKDKKGEIEVIVSDEKGEKLKKDIKVIKKKKKKK